MKVLVTGGGGTLGRPTVAALLERGVDVVVTARHPRPGAAGPPQRRFELSTGDGADDAVAGCDAVLHLASDTNRFGKDDVMGTSELLRACERAGTAHLVYISIVGCDEIPLPYYVRKTAVERAIAESAVPHTILRATQFHEFVARLAGEFSKPYLTFVPKGVRFQVLDSAVAARRLAELAGGPPQGRVTDIGGPEVLDLPQMIKEYLAATGRRRPVLPVPLFGAAYRGFLAGRQLTPDHADHTGRTWHEWLADVARPG